MGNSARNTLHFYRSTGLRWQWKAFTGDMSRMFQSQIHADTSLLLLLIIIIIKKIITLIIENQLQCNSCIQSLKLYFTAYIEILFCCHFDGYMTNLVSNIHGRFSISIQTPDQFIAARRNTLFTMHGLLIPLALFGQKAGQRARGISFHALPPQPQMFTSKTSPLKQVGA